MNVVIGKLSSYLLKAVLWIISILYIYPILLVLISSIKTKRDLATNPFGLPKEFTLDYFQAAYQTMHYFRSILNTSFIGLVSVGISVIITSMAAYVIARRNNKFYNAMYLLFLAGMIIPFQMTMIPLYKVMLSLQLISTYQGVIFIYLASLAPFSVFLLSGFVKSVPRELEEAALIDGCGIYKTFFMIVFPLLKPAITTVSVLNLFHIWNDFLMPMLYIQDSKKITITVQLASFQGRYFNDWSLIFAGVCMIVFPMLIIYLLAQRFIIDGITAGAVKG
ncbi:carbohydrate ABC transporter permease [Paenibacillus sedimenti]|uniref:Carbohydrate ABC transporter permease n=1 Tax=Paenibacillus sedimenti TaxID=2770274 RepID=A0A926QJY3_9BACL|nr:carbohydrate ABC transporter permease [Paenibacillus sedimenti]MBD0380907.1 carbohydrate ABC transporter permease [Paenibacillus sedimenti]